MDFIKTYEEWIFNVADNQDLPAVGVDQERGYPKRIPDPEATKTLIFNPDDEDEYPNRINDDTHGFSSHAIKHMWEFDPNLYSKFIIKTKDILKHYIDVDMKIIDKRGRIDDDIYDDEDIEDMSLYSIINALDFINDKTYEKTKLSEVETEIYNLIIRPLRIEYKKFITYIFDNAVDLEDYTKDMGNVPVYFQGDNEGRYLNYYDPNIKGIMITNKNKEIVYCLFKIRRNSIFDYFNLLNPGSTKRRPPSDIMQLLKSYGK